MPNPTKPMTLDPKALEAAPATDELASRVGLVLHKTPHQIAVEVAHERIRYGQSLEEGLRDPEVLPMLKRAIFKAVKQCICEAAGLVEVPVIGKPEGSGE